MVILETSFGPRWAPFTDTHGNLMAAGRAGTAHLPQLAARQEPFKPFLSWHNRLAAPLTVYSP